MILVQNLAITLFSFEVCLYRGLLMLSNYFISHIFPKLGKDGRVCCYKPLIIIFLLIKWKYSEVVSLMGKRPKQLNSLGLQ